MEKLVFTWKKTKYGWSGHQNRRFHGKRTAGTIKLTTDLDRAMPGLQKAKKYLAFDGDGWPISTSNTIEGAKKLVETNQRREIRLDPKDEY